MDYCARIILQVLLLLTFSSVTIASDTEEKESFNTVEYIFEHVNDSHELYFFSAGNVHFSIPLPVILYSRETGWHLFSSSKLRHKAEGYPFRISTEGKNKDKIIEQTGDGIETVPLDLSLTKTVFGIIIVSLLLIFFLIKASRRTSRSPMAPPKGIQNIVEPVVLFIRDDVAKPFAGKKYARYMPYLLTIFSFILISNLLGLIVPIGFNITGNIAVTLILAVFTFIITTFSGNKHYWLEIINPHEVPWFMKIPIPLIPFVEFLGIFTKPVILMVRLFANMFAGHMIIAVLVALIFLMSSLFNPIVGVATSVIAVLFSIFIIIVDVLVSFIQAYIFTLLSAMYFGMATSDNKH
jgi:F-type H+-transporting ATPase subunit a